MTAQTVAVGAVVAVLRVLAARGRLLRARSQRGRGQLTSEKGCSQKLGEH